MPRDERGGAYFCVPNAHYGRLNVHLEISPSFGDVLIVQVTPARSFPAADRPWLTASSRRHLEPAEPRRHRTAPRRPSASALWPAGPSGSATASLSRISPRSSTTPLQRQLTSSPNRRRSSCRRRHSRCCATPAETVARRVAVARDRRTRLAQASRETATAMAIRSGSISLSVSRIALHRTTHDVACCWRDGCYWICFASRLSSGLGSFRGRLGADQNLTIAAGLRCRGFCLPIIRSPAPVPHGRDNVLWRVRPRASVEEGRGHVLVSMAELCRSARWRVGTRWRPLSRRPAANHMVRRCRR